MENKKQKNIRDELQYRLEKEKLIFYSLGDIVRLKVDKRFDKRADKSLEGRVVCITTNALSNKSKEMLEVRVKTKDGHCYGAYSDFEVISYARSRKRVPMFMDDIIIAKNLKSINLTTPKKIKGPVIGLRFASEPWHYPVSHLIKDPKAKELHEQMEKRYTAENNDYISKEFTNPQRYIAMVLNMKTIKLYDIPLNMLKLIKMDERNKIFEIL